VKQLFSLGALVVAVALAASDSAVGQSAQTPAQPAAQGRGGRGQTPPALQPPPTPRAAAPIDLTGNWVSIVSEDWRWRMVTPPKGDYASIPLNDAAKKVADTWDPVASVSGDQCKTYGAPGLMRLPTRLRVTWQDDTTLKVETDAGTQTRLLHFGEWKPSGGGPTRQGDTTAQWETRQQGRRGQPLPPPEQRFGNLKTVTTGLMPGFLRKNGVPYSEKTTLTEYWDLLRPAGGAQWIVITTIVEDPTYLSRTWITSLNFRKEPNGSKWDPEPCIGA